MNDQTAKLLEQLAGKLGTTSEYLWSVLLKQAPVAATITLIQILLVLAAGIGLWKAHQHFLNDDNKVSYYNLNEGLAVPMVVGCIFWLILLIAAFFLMEEIINGYFNPEFWALDYIMGKLSDK